MMLAAFYAASSPRATTSGLKSGLLASLEIHLLAPVP